MAWFRPFYFFYLRKILPLVAGAVTGDRAAYVYLNETIEQFPNAATLADEIRAAWEIAERHHLHKPVVEQPQYHLFHRQKVEQVVARVDNVRQVLNELAVQSASSLTQRSNDVLTTGKVKAAYVDAQDLFANAFKVVTERGTTYLMGRVTQREADRATEITRNTQGVQRVVRVLEIISDEELRRIQAATASAAPVENRPAQ